MAERQVELARARGKDHEKTGTHPAQLKDDVQSPGGFSVYGMHKLETGGLNGLLMDAVEAATNRSRATGDKALPREIRNSELLQDIYDEEKSEVDEAIFTPKRHALRR
ncbi:hypothetical protein RB195_021835 [Necator americanus]|uniref:Pyrroline-5-carboxylate reductase dimerisation domain-containing protein n=1 Tax=Necator americanus TaxID=51031 RepID=A0ABR1ECU7_NECAM